MRKKVGEREEEGGEMREEEGEGEAGKRGGMYADAAVAVVFAPHLNDPNVIPAQHQFLPSAASVVR